jgi:hypothetical protein
MGRLLGYLPVEAYREQALKCAFTELNSAAPALASRLDDCEGKPMPRFCLQMIRCARMMHV